MIVHVSIECSSNRQGVKRICSNQELKDVVFVEVIVNHHEMSFKHDDYLFTQSISTDAISFRIFSFDNNIGILFLFYRI